jgi:hydrogenase nickel incorporation protein HypB
MCDTCGCSDTPLNSPLTKGGERGVIVDVNQSLLKKNEDAALNNRKHFDEKGILVINLISSPGSGKTTLLEKTIEKLKSDISIGVLEGDIETYSPEELLDPRTMDTTFRIMRVDPSKHIPTGEVLSKGYL